MTDNKNWVLTENSFPEKKIREWKDSLYFLGNRMLGHRGLSLFSNKQCYLNGFYELEALQYGEKFTGFPDDRQTMLSLPSLSEPKIYINGNKADVFHIKFYERSLDFREGVLLQNTGIFMEKSLLSVSSSHVLPLTRPGVSAVRYVFTALSGSIGLCAELLLEDAVPDGDEDDPRKAETISHEAIPHRDISFSEEGFSCHCKTARSEMKFSVEGVFICSDSGCMKAGKSLSLTKQLEEGQSLELVVIQAWTSAGLHLNPKLSPSLSFEKLMNEQKNRLSEFWSYSDVVLEGKEDLTLALRYNLFALIQSVGQGSAGLAAKGLSSTGYDGHYFWDTEIYVLPVMAYLQPDLARNMLEFRIGTMAQAKQRAQLLGFEGVLFPWRTINGEEASAYYPAGTAQYHINADITWSLGYYLDVTGDESILNEGGRELLAETARFWSSFFTYVSGKGYCLHSVTGPDEYSLMADNNYYTNAMAAHNLKLAAFWCRAEAGISASEIFNWGKMAEQVYLPFEDKKMLNMQSDGYLEKPVWNFGATPADKYPLLLNYHPLHLNRFQVLKQPDVVMGHFLLPRLNTADQIRRDFHYYETLTTGDSSLAHASLSIVAARLGETSSAYKHFSDSVCLDLHNLHGNSDNGIHTAAMGGSWQAVALGFGGLGIVRENDKVRLSVDPLKIKELPAFSIYFSFRLRNLSFSVNEGRFSLRLKKGEALEVLIKNEVQLLKDELIF